MAATPTAPALTSEQADATIRSKRYAALLVVVAVIGVIVSLAAWCFLEAIYQIQQELYVHLPHAVGYQHGPPKWWALPVLALGGLMVALAITRLPGDGGHIPAKGLAMGGGAPDPKALSGVVLAGLATVGSGLILGPEAPLIALGSGVAVLTISLARRNFPNEALLIIAAAGSFSAVSFIFESPLLAAVLLIEATGIGGPRLRVIVVPGLLAAGIGSLVSIGLGSFTGLNTSHYALGALPLAAAGHPHLGEFAWTIALAIAIAVATSFVLRGGLRTYRLVSKSRLPRLLPVIALIIGVLAIVFSQITGKSFEEVLFSGQDALPGLVSQASTWSVGALLWLLLIKGIGYSLSLGSFRGGPTFPALFLGAAAGVAASHLPGFPIQAGVAVGMAAGIVAVLRLPLSAVVITTVLTSHAGANVEPLIIVGVVVTYVVTLLLASRSADERPAIGASPPAPPPEASPRSRSSRSALPTEA
ncbi:MAG: chloride channel protein [Solirubrobacterales bacterium]|nr:chloride channel protein [Solirubrobacterales bacterium]